MAINVTAKQVKEEFASYWEGVTSPGSISSASQKNAISTAHKYAKCFAFLATATNNQEQHKRIFLQELSSDSIHLVHTLKGGDARGGKFYLRSIIENFWSHHYFRDHPIEFDWLHSRDGYYLEIKSLREHCGWLNCFQGSMKNIATTLPVLYAKLSKSVHNTSSRTLVLREAISDIQLSEEQSKSIQRDILVVMKTCLSLLIFSEREVFLALHENVQEFMLNSITADQKQRIIKAFADSGDSYIFNDQR